MSKVSYGIRIKDMHNVFRDTIAIFRKAIKSLIPVVLENWTDIEPLNSLERQQHIEHLVHGTAKRKALYPFFDRKYHKMPSYFMRSAITTAIGAVDKYMQETDRWHAGGCKGKEPHLNYNQAFMPCFFRGNTFKVENGITYIKVFRMNDWVFIPLKLKESDIQYIRRHFLEEGSAPVLRQVNHRYMLQFMFSLPKSEKKFVTDKKVQKVIGTDLGINNDAVCSAITRDGTVTGVKFINSPVEKDRLRHVLNLIKKAQQNGGYRPHRLWRWADNYNTTIAVNTSSAIVQFAIEQDADVIVFEYLNFTGRKHGSKAQRLALWRKREIQQRVEAAAKRHGIRVAYVNAKNTSKLAYDGSGEVRRDKHNHSMCTFVNGKRYNCDLSASKNIGARYILKCMEKSTSDKKWSSWQAKVPAIGVRTGQTLSTLISLIAEMAA